MVGLEDSTRPARREGFPDRFSAAVFLRCLVTGSSRPTSPRVGRASCFLACDRTPAVADAVWSLVPPETTEYLDDLVQGDVGVKRLAGPFLRLVRPWLAPSHDPRESAAADPVLPRFLAWRLRVAGGGDPHHLPHRRHRHRRASDGTGRGRSLNVRAEPGARIEAGPADVLRRAGRPDLALSFYAMPASSLLAAACWARPRASRSILLAGWAGSFLVPVAIALTPWSWWEAWRRRRWRAAAS